MRKERSQLCLLSYRKNQAEHFASELAYRPLGAKPRGPHDSQTTWINYKPDGKYPS
jgi:hypothetical protein